VEVLKHPIVILGLTVLLSAIGAVSYSWASWTTKTLMSVDKRTAVMASEISTIKNYMVRDYGYVEKSDDATSVQAAK
jgi:hypothetical protein